MIILDYKDRRPIYEQIIEKLEELMLCGVLNANDPLPSVRSLAMELSINPNTIQRAYSELERHGYIYSVKGKGSFVAANHAVRENRGLDLRERLSVVIDDAIRLGLPEQELIDMIRRQYTEAENHAGGENV